jgi:transposase
MDRQTLRDWVIRFNAHGPEGLINNPSPGVPPKLEAEHRAFLSRVVEEGPIPAVHGVVRWRACDLIALLQEEFGSSVLDDTVYRALKASGFAHLSARPKAYRQDPEAMEAFKKTPCPCGASPSAAHARHTRRSLVPDAMKVDIREADGCPTSEHGATHGINNCRRRQHHSCCDRAQPVNLAGGGASTSSQ